ncbi:MAG TPA: transporter substrate-binding domain-containing protein [Thermodesulfobacteriota bacterium]|nr:transporter substrate-binding domain-containing protein [Thermodesulfobacteriota bacterium]
MKRLFAVLMFPLLLSLPAGAFAETTLEKINRTGVLTIGTRTGIPGFAFVNDKKEWVGFSIDLVEQGVAPAISKKLGKAIKVEKKESTPPTRIPLLTSNTVDLVAETMTDTRSRRETVEFSLTYFVTGAQFLVKKGSPIKGAQDIGGKRIAALKDSTTAKVLREKYKSAECVEFPDQTAAFQALGEGKVDAFTGDGTYLAGLIGNAPNPADWLIAGSFYTYEPYGMAMRRNESDFRHAVNRGLMEIIESGKYFEFYDKWFGAGGKVPYPLTAETKAFLVMQVVPK